jgi:hypothetical protein
LGQIVAVDAPAGVSAGDRIGNREIDFDHIVDVRRSFLLRLRRTAQQLSALTITPL